MGIVISSVTTEIGGGSSIEQAAAAARRAIAEAGTTPERIDALINTGVYRDSNMVEPAMSALIQQQAGIGLEYHSGDVPCLSFDLMNGACGILNAVQVSQALLEAPTVHRVLLVSGDAHPSKSPEPQAGFPIKPVGAAMLLEKVPGTAGFGALHISATDGRPAAEGYLRLSEMGTTGRSSITVNRTTGLEELLHHAISAASEALEVADVPADRVVLICGRPTADFPHLLAQRLGIDPEAVSADDTESDAHTSALPVAFLAARDSGKLERADVALFVAAGAGPSAAAIAYRLPKR
ncbi:3-oxoacyl-[acyl-carrier-protein] synthase III C-terminal domain-containing protein [Nocardia sp. CDC160]|uniref:3-oxoacyl-[acyl-carrier-protein] synthase III C-terminal domain-containing protein n=1 Tax=Nocardia sp. CDC160 TaxID=3112166 RepID=UPI002DB87BCA|nr:3-oxoacyl-[acyl-carrier-protein] synthase III C-terminal domain-containing protein [Nocardia sp. CDC160]MEC3919621.1 3-oxoacyl-[acyl-carrier-protein] synthase III C-terminal domain-containing protein [Nocardia sp. CDC160]